MQRTLTKQQVLDEAIQHMANQNWIPSIDSECKFTNEPSSCLYRGPQNRKCIVGYFLLDEYYNSDFENLNLNSIMVFEAVSNSIQIEELDEWEMEDFLSDLQAVHDDILKDMCKLNGDFVNTVAHPSFTEPLKIAFLAEFKQFALSNELQFNPPV